MKLIRIDRFIVNLDAVSYFKVDESTGDVEGIFDIAGAPIRFTGKLGVSVAEWLDEQVIANIQSQPVPPPEEDDVWEDEDCGTESIPA
jgi:hypothetical protein